MKIYLKYGLICGLILSGWITIGYLFHWYKTGFLLSWTITGLAVQAVIVFTAIRQERAKIYNGEIPYIRALGTGVFTSLVAAIIYATGNFILFTLWDYSDLQQFVLEQIKSQLPVDKQATAEQDALKNFSPSYQALSTFLQTLIFGLVLSLIFAMFLRRRDAENIITKQ